MNLPSLFFSLLRLLAFLLPLVGVASTSAAELPQHVAGEVIVGFKPEATPTQIKQFEEENTLTVITNFRAVKARHYKLPNDSTVETAIVIFVLNPVVEYAEPNYIRKAHSLPTDPLFGSQWYLQNTGQTVHGLTGTAGKDIQWTQAMEVFTGTQSVVVGHVDSGVAIDHPEITSIIWKNPRDRLNDIDDDDNSLVDDVIGWNYVYSTNLPLDQTAYFGPT